MPDDIEQIATRHPEPVEPAFFFVSNVGDAILVVGRRFFDDFNGGIHQTAKAKVQLVVLKLEVRSFIDFIDHAIKSGRPLTVKKLNTNPILIIVHLLTSGSDWGKIYGI